MYPNDTDSTKTTITSLKLNSTFGASNIYLKTKSLRNSKIDVKDNSLNDSKYSTDLTKTTASQILPINMSTSTGAIDGSSSGRGGVNCGIDGISNSNNVEKNISSCSTLDIDDKVDNLTTAEVLIQLKELKIKLERSENERDEFKKRHDNINYEKEKVSRQLEVISSAHENRITEMHCVIAELSKKLRNKQDNTILEENELEGSEISFQEGSVYNSEMNLTNPDAECQTEPIEDMFGDLNNSNFEDEFNENFNNDSAVAKTKVDTLQEEVFRLKAHIALLESQLASNNDSSILEPNLINHINNSLEKVNQFNYTENYDQDCTEGINVCSEKELNCFYSSNDDNEIYKTDGDAATDNDYVVTSERNNVFINTSSAIKKSTTKYLQTNMNLPECGCHIKTPNPSLPIPKMAERVKLRRTVEQPYVTESDVLNLTSNKIELIEPMISSDISLNDFIDSPDYRFESERLKRRADNLKARNLVLCLTLNEVKEHLDHIYLLCGKYESNAVALQCALNYSDRAIEAYDVMLALLESKLAILKENSMSAEESRNAVESVARHLLHKLESEKNLLENSLGPWQNTFCINDSQPLDPWTTEDDNRLRNHVSKLKGHRAAAQNTVVNLESTFSSHYEKARMIMESNNATKKENKQMDLEMAVLMQELLNLREDIVEEKQKCELAVKEKEIAIEKSYFLEETLQQLQLQLTDSEAFLNVASKDRTSFSEADHAALIERQLVEALTRESELRNRIQTLIGTVSPNKKYDEKHFQVQNTELHKINLNLSHSLEQTKKKYQNKIRRLEQKISEMNLELVQLQNFNHQNNDNVPETTL